MFRGASQRITSAPNQSIAWTLVTRLREFGFPFGVMDIQKYNPRAKQYYLRIERAAGLARTDKGSTDPYCVVFLNCANGRTRSMEDFSHNKASRPQDIRIAPRCRRSNQDLQIQN